MAIRAGDLIEIYTRYGKVIATVDRINHSHSQTQIHACKQWSDNYRSCWWVTPTDIRIVQGQQLHLWKEEA